MNSSIDRRRAHAITHGEIALIGTFTSVFCANLVTLSRGERTTFWFWPTARVTLAGYPPMLGGMFVSAQKPKVFQSIIRFVAVDMVNVLVATKRPPDVLRHHFAMLKYSMRTAPRVSSRRAIDVPLTISQPLDAAWPPRHACFGAVSSTPIAQSHWRGLKHFAAGRANASNRGGTLSGHRSLQSAGAMPRGVTSTAGASSRSDSITLLASN